MPPLTSRWPRPAFAVACAAVLAIAVGGTTVYDLTAAS